MCMDDVPPFLFDFFKGEPLDEELSGVRPRRHRKVIVRKQLETLLLALMSQKFYDSQLPRS